MATRSGSVDPGLVLWLLEHEHVDVQDLAHALEHEAGLLGLAGTADMRELLARDDDDAALALGVYVHRLTAAIAAMAAALGGLDALAFTGGVGERSAEVRRRAVERLGFLGLAVDEQRNRDAVPDADVSAADASARTLVISAREDLEMARQARPLLAR
jgi:acetate kinase